MKPDINKELKKLLTSLCPKIKITYATMKKYISTGYFPADVCLNVDRVTKGRISANQLRPGLFEGLQADNQLAQRCIDSFEEQLESKNFILLIGVLDFMQVRQPVLYEQMISELGALQSADEFLAQRAAYRSHGKI